MTDHSPIRSTNISRRDFLKITAIAGLTLGMGAAIRRNLLHEGGYTRITETRYLMGTIVNFNILTTDEYLGQEALRRTVTEMERLISIFDHRQAGSILRKLNQAGVLNEAPVELVEIITQSLRFGSLSGGAFDITVLPILEAFKAGISDTKHLMHLVDFRNVSLTGNQIRFAHPGMAVTLDGLAKGRVVDGGVDVLKSMGFENVLVEAGGDMMAASAAINGEDWKIAINNPRSTSENEYIASFSVKNKAVTTSGDYLNSFTLDHSRHHIIDPRTCLSPVELSSATVIASNAAEADALSTALMVLGVSDGLDFIRHFPHAEALLLTKDLTVHKTDGFPLG